MRYQDVYKSWAKEPETHWMKSAEAIDWFQKPSKALFDDNAPYYEWFADGQVNACYNAVDRHVENGRGEQCAIIYDSPVTGVKSKITYAELHKRTAKLAAALQRKGVGVGDRVIIYMPMVPEAVISMLACARIGAIHSVVFGGFAAHELSVRINDAQPKAILAASVGIEPTHVVPYKPLLDDAIALADHKPDFCVVLQRDGFPAALAKDCEFDWEAFQQDADFAACVPLPGNHPAYILYTSGTTGAPKGVIRHTAGNLVSLAWTMPNIYNAHPGDVYWAASDVGWVVGHSYIVYAPLICGLTTVLYEGKPVGTPDAGAFWRVISEYSVKCLFTAPTAFRAIRREDPMADEISKYDLTSLQSLFLAGERADPDTIEWAQEHLGIPVVDHWWQTETGWAIAANPLGIETLPVKLGSPAVPMPGYTVEILDETGARQEPNTLGSIAIKLPLPPGTLPSLWQADDRFRASYLSEYPGYYATGDAGMVDDDGYLYIMARTDDVINVAGHRLSTGAMEEVLTSHAQVAECAVIGVADPLKGQIPLGLICLTRGVDRNEQEIVAEIVKLVRDRIGPVAAFKKAIVVERLPKTRSGKILRATMVHIANGTEWKMPATIDDPKILEEITTRLAEEGFAKS